MQRPLDATYHQRLDIPVHTHATPKPLSQWQCSNKLVEIPGEGDSGEFLIHNLFHVFIEQVKDVPLFALLPVPFDMIVPGAPSHCRDNVQERH